MTTHASQPFSPLKSESGTKLPLCYVRDPVATGSKSDMARTAQFGPD